MLFTLALVTLAFATAAKSTATLSTSNTSIAGNNFITLLAQIQQERNFDSILLLRRSDEACPLFHLFSLSATPILLLTPEQHFYLKQHFNSELLSIVCLQREFDADLLAALANDLQHMRQTRVLILAKQFRNPQSLLPPMQAFCETHKLTNVLLLFDNAHPGDNFYRYHPFPSGRFVPVVFATAGQFFPEHFLNMQGKALRTLPDQIVTRSLVYYDRNGEQQLSGYVGKLALLFARQYNATLKLLRPVSVGEIIHMSVLINATRSGLLDFGLTVGGGIDVADLHCLTYPMESVKWMIMTPCPQQLSIAETYRIITRPRVVLVILVLFYAFSLLHSVMVRQFHSSRHKEASFMLNDKIMRGILGQAFVQKSSPVLALKLLYLCLFFLGLMVSTMYQAFLHTLLTSPPYSRPINTFEDLRAANMKVMIDSKDFALLETTNGADYCNAIRDVLELVETTVFQSHRWNMYTTHSYSVTSSLWPIFEKQQQHYRRKHFCTPPALKLSTVLLGVPLQENSEYKEAFDRLIFRVSETGFMEHWLSITFVDLVALGNISLKYKGAHSKFHDIRVVDLQSPFYFFLLGMAASLVVFLAETCAQCIKNGKRCKTVWKR